MRGGFVYMYGEPHIERTKNQLTYQVSNIGCTGTCKRFLCKSMQRFTTVT
jgi:hypothetical protein